ncbi:MAG: dihydrofolate reductase family protein [Candidatus Diapherotrites archaeon]|uniref:Dihydrofolate reductase family protein n=1 Tax=Candidatus Iainarchaeum sp. TaxID=3101447 RepID=A0A8T4LE38_9ARCH|nr:dihydrofolate reductase family protein [Candidatus Diapherotrites archaeon]
MRKIIVLQFVTLDGVVQAPGGPTEDSSGGFKFGGWVTLYFDDFSGKEMEKQMGPSDLLLGRKTFDIFAAYWPDHADQWPGINEKTKFVASKSLSKSVWKNTVFLKGNLLDELKKLKSSNGPDLQVHGSANFIQTLLKNDLVDELWLKIFPITLGKGKRLFDGGAIPAAFKLKKSNISPLGVIFANYERAGDVQTASIV